MKTATVALLVSASAFAAVPVIDTESVTVKQSSSRTVTISYTLGPASEGDAEPAIITADILTNGVSVGGGNLWTLSGDVNRVVSQGKRKILWQPNEEGMPEFKLPAAQVTAKITAWSTNAPPTYWVIDLSTADKMKDRLSDRFYPNAEQIPLTVTNMLYKTDRLVFRRIPAKGVTWRQGASSDDYADVTTIETPRYVSFSYDYYMAVFELTRAQYARLSRNFDYRIAFDVNATEEDYASARPLTGTPKSYQFNGWDIVASFDPNGSRIRTLSAQLAKVKNAILVNVDFPTVAEFEFACRAGSSGLWVGGDDFSKYAWTDESVGDAQAFHDVGLKEANDWGIYDIQGNVAELALDWFYSTGDQWGPVTIRPSDPVWDTMGPVKDSNNRSTFGGHYASQKAHCRASVCSRMAPAQALGLHLSQPSYNTGVRFVLIMP